jgi:hypothetical protein
MLGVGHFRSILLLLKCESCIDLARTKCLAVEPVNQLELAVVMLDERGAALDPVAAIAIENAAEIANFRVMDMAADNAIDAAPRRSPCRQTKRCIAWRSSPAV